MMDQQLTFETDREAVRRQRFDFAPIKSLFSVETDAFQVVQHMQTYWSILERVKGSSLRLTKIDDEIYDHLKEAFPEFDAAATIDEDEMKSKAGKERWRKFMMAYEKRVDDYNFGTMVRNNPKAEYEEDTTIFGEPGKLPEVQAEILTQL